jgi:hypothetical protein
VDAPRDTPGDPPPESAPPEGVGAKVGKLADGLFLVGLIVLVPGTLLWWFRNHTEAPSLLAVPATGAVTGGLFGLYFGLRNLRRPARGWGMVAGFTVGCAVVGAVGFLLLWGLFSLVLLPLLNWLRGAPGNRA